MDERCVADAQVVDVAAHDELVVDHALLVLAHLAEDARVAVGLREAVVLHPREERALPPSAGLRHAVDWLHYLVAIIGLPSEPMRSFS